MDHERKRELGALMARLASGDRAAFDPIYEALWPVVQGFARRVLAGSADADDAAQVALVKVFARAAEYEAERDALAWVLGVAAYECKTFRQKGRRRREAPALADDVPATSATPEELVLTRDLEAAALEVLGSLRPADIEVLQALIEGRRIPGATFRKRLERALVRLRTAWSSRHDVD
jgi:RNA polymerase sigma-70 factor (ECF subfamily)